MLHLYTTVKLAGWRCKGVHLFIGRSGSAHKRTMMCIPKKLHNVSLVHDSQVGRVADPERTEHVVHQLLAAAALVHGTGIAGGAGSGAEQEAAAKGEAAVRREVEYREARHVPAQHLVHCNLPRPARPQTRTHIRTHAQ